MNKRIFFPQKDNYIIRKNGFSVPVIYEDNHCIAVIKPAGILSQSDISGEDDLLGLLKSDIKERYEKPGNVFVGLIHRLDRNTQGCMIFAKTSKGASRISEELRNKRMFKGYFAVCRGALSREKGFLENFLEKDEKENKVRESKNGKKCLLYYEKVAEKDGVTLVFAVPVTGRTHQIRAQFSLAGNPLCGDGKYGRDTGNDLALCSSALCVKHPVNEELLCFFAIPSGKYFDIFNDGKYAENYIEKSVVGRIDELSELKENG